MKNKKIWLDGFREIKNTIGRFLSLLLIIALGAGFFIGIRAAAPDMEAIANQYYDSQNLEDMSIQSTLGLNDDDMAILEDIEGIEYEPYAYVDRQFSADDSTARFYPNFNDMGDMNQFEVTDGRLPEANNEIAIDQILADQNPDSYAIGQTVSLTDLGVEEDDNAEETPSLTEDEFEIVGYVNSPLQISTISRGSTTIGDGILDGYAVVSPDVIDNAGTYMNVAIDVLDADGLEAYTDEYDQVIADKQEEIESAFEGRPAEVYDETVSEANSEISSGQAEIDSANEAISSGADEIDQAQSQIDDGREELDQQESQVESQLPEGVTLEQAGMTSVAAQLEAGAQSLDEAQSELDSARTSFESESSTASESLASAESDLSEAQSTVDDLSEPTYNINDRSAVSGYTSWMNNADNMAAIGQAFPVIFFLIAALVSFTNMQRMVTEQRVQIGTYKAMGYSARTIQVKYLMYAGFAAVIGLAIGIGVGNYLFPNIIVGAFADTVTLPGMIYTWQPTDILIAIGISFLTTIVPAYLTTRKTLNEKTADLLRPANNKKGSHVFVERFKKYWNKLSFQSKITWRNLFLYKGRNLMTILGVAGCAMLIVTGFGLSDSISGLPDEQFSTVKPYDATVTLNTEADQEAQDAVLTYLDDNDAVDQTMTAASEVFMTDDPNITQQIVTLMAIDPETNYHDYYQLADMETEESLDLPEDGVLVTAKIAQLLDLSVGDNIELTDTNSETVEFPIKGIVENYLGHEIYMSEQYYADVFGEEATENSALVKYTGDANQEDEDALEADLSDMEGSLGTQFNASTASDFEETLAALDLVTVVLIVSAGMLAAIVLYSLTNINVSERMHELATIKVLGFRSREVSTYVYRETLILTVIGIIIGNVMGLGLLTYILETVSIDQAYFPIVIHWDSYLYSGLLTLLFSIIVMIIMHYKLKNIEMVSALKEED